jgi:hypothetical protein
MPAANSVPRFIASPIIGVGALSVANTNRDGTGTLVDVATGEVSGTVVDLIHAIATGTTSGGMIRLFIFDPATGLTKLYDEIAVSAITPSATVKAFQAELIPSTPLILPEGVKLRASTHQAEGFVVYAIGGDY